MKEFKSITEKQILYITSNEIYNRYEKEKQILERNTKNEIAKFKMQRFKEQYDEISKRILEIEKEEK